MTDFKGRVELNDDVGGKSKGNQDVESDEKRRHDEIEYHHQRSHDGDSDGHDEDVNFPDYLESAVGIYQWYLHMRSYPHSSSEGRFLNSRPEFIKKHTNP